MLRPDHEWVRFYCDKQSDADGLRTDARFMAPVVAQATERMLRNRLGSTVVVEFIPADSSYPTYETVRWGELDALLERWIAALQELEDYEECQVLADLRRAVQERELAEEPG